MVSLFHAKQFADFRLGKRIGNLQFNFPQENAGIHIVGPRSGKVAGKL